MSPSMTRWAIGMSPHPCRASPPTLIFPTLRRKPLIVVFLTAKLWRGIQTFAATRSSADERHRIKILQRVLSSEGPVNHKREARC